MAVPPPLRIRLGEALRAQREHWGLSQDRLAHRVGVTPRYLAGAERGERNWTLNTVDEVSAILGVDPVALLNGALIDELPPEREMPSDANPRGRKGSRGTRRP
ncbi:MAG: helix-turn-helix domain-containing protein [Leucobacter sp.]